MVLLLSSAVDLAGPLMPVRSVRTFRASCSRPASRRRHLVNGEPPPPLVDELVTQTLQRVLFDRPET